MTDQALIRLLWDMGPFKDAWAGEAADKALTPAIAAACRKRVNDIYSAEIRSDVGTVCPNLFIEGANRSGAAL